MPVQDKYSRLSAIVRPEGVLPDELCAAALRAQRRRRWSIALGLSAAGAALIGGVAFTAQRVGRGDTRNAEELYEDCHTAEHGERCHADVVFAMRNRDVHPEWYIGLNNCSTFQDYQSFMHTQVLNSGERRCPKPCNGKPKHAPASGTKCKKAKKEKDCHTTVPGDECYAHVIYTRKQADKYPKWYPGLTGESSVSEVQHYLNQENVCPEPCDVVHRQKSASKELKGCHTALPGDTCYADILLAKHKFILKHPEWYKGLTKDSSNDEFQAFLHNQKHSEEAAEKACPNPCNASLVEKAFLRAHCKTADVGDDCYESVMWGRTVGIIKHPEWYGNLTTKSSFEDFQLHLHKDNHTKCDDLPCPCRTAVFGSKCYWSIQWARTKGIKEYPKAFEGLTAQSSFTDFQAHLFEKHGEDHCSRPCKTFPGDPRSPWQR